MASCYPSHRMYVHHICGQLHKQRIRAMLLHCLEQGGGDIECSGQFLVFLTGLGRCNRHAIHHHIHGFPFKLTAARSHSVTHRFAVSAVHENCSAPLIVARQCVHALLKRASVHVETLRRVGQQCVDQEVANVTRSPRDEDVANWSIRGHIYVWVLRSTIVANRYLCLSTEWVPIREEWQNNGCSTGEGVWGDSDSELRVGGGLGTWDLGLEWYNLGRKPRKNGKSKWNSSHNDTMIGYASR